MGRLRSGRQGPLHLAERPFQGLPARARACEEGGRPGAGHAFAAVHGLMPSHTPPPSHVHAACADTRHGAPGLCPPSAFPLREQLGNGAPHGSHAWLSRHTPPPCGTFFGKVADAMLHHAVAMHPLLRPPLPLGLGACASPPPAGLPLRRGGEFHAVSKTKDHARMIKVKTQDHVRPPFRTRPPPPRRLALALTTPAGLLRR